MTFTPEQRADLLSLGVPLQALARLESEALPDGSCFLKLKVTRNQVLAQLARIDRDLARAQATILALFDAKPKDPKMAALVAARKAMHASHPKIHAGITLHRTAVHLQWSRRQVERGVKRVPDGPVRHTTASPHPVSLIHDALQMGAMDAGLEELPRPLWPSVAPKSKFRDVVSICYAAMDAKNADPERAIRDYVKNWRALCRTMENAAAAQNVPSED